MGVVFFLGGGGWFMRHKLNITHTSVAMNKYVDTVVCICTRHFKGTVIYAAPLSLRNLWSGNI